MNVYRSHWFESVIPTRIVAHQAYFQLPTCDLEVPWACQSCFLVACISRWTLLVKIRVSHAQTKPLLILLHLRAYYKRRTADGQERVPNGQNIDIPSRTGHADLSEGIEMDCLGR